MNGAGLVTARSLKTLDLDGDGARSPAGDLVLPLLRPGLVRKFSGTKAGSATQRPAARSTTQARGWQGALAMGARCGLRVQPPFWHRQVPGGGADSSQVRLGCGSTQRDEWVGVGSGGAPARSLQCSGIEAEPVAALTATAARQEQRQDPGAARDC